MDKTKNSPSFAKNTRKTFVALLIPLSTILLSACSDPGFHITDSDQNYCAAINNKAPAELSKYLAPYKDNMEKSTGVYILEQGTEAILTRAWLSEQAQQTIDVQYFIFSSDNIGLIAVDYLVKAAERGIKVRMLVDDLMVDAKESQLLKLAAHENISIKIYNPMLNIGKNFVAKVVNLTTNFHGINQRMHNKTFTVDGKVVITGGRNLADEYFGYDHEYNFRDRDVLLLGGVTNDIQMSFNQYWDNDLSVPIEDLISSNAEMNTNFDALHQYACNPLNFLPEVRQQIKNLPDVFQELEQTNQLHWLNGVEYVSDLPGKNDGNTFLGGSGLSTERLILLLQHAKKSVTIQSPYLVTTDLSRNLFKSLVDRGVEIKILTNSLASNDNFEAFNGYQRDRKKLLETGVEIYEFKPDAQIRKKIMSKEMQGKLPEMPIFSLHAKSMVIDDNITVIGTFNVDPRSANLNTESITIIPSKEISTAVKAGMLEEMQPENAWQTTLDWNPDGEETLVKQLKVKLRRVVPKSIL
ncbi:phospholipase D family protein [Colwellia echini]|uniref:Phospholipase D family protein n=1 Tax=Colwellia echini TaxID=1982103 RepID=A0ABY3MZN2_9GAMM|nr:phospholipase D family protein [Colwellia echini]TYK66662.1 phospholipase D family protein [Colwellia echini]